MPEPIVDRFWRHVVEIGGPMDTPCWVHRKNPSLRRAWSMYLTKRNGRKVFVTASRWAYTHIARKPIAPDRVLMAMCDNGGCVNPAHRTPVHSSQIPAANGADGKTGVYGNRNPMRKYPGLQAGERSGRCKLRDDQVLWVLSQRGKMTRPALASSVGVSRSTIDHIFEGKRTVTPPTPHCGETGRYSPHGHRGTRTQAHRREAGSGDGQAHDHQDPDRGLREPDRAGNVLG